MITKIAITGVIGSGKSTLRKIIDQLGYPVCDIDELNRTLLRKQSTIEHLCLLFGPNICKGGVLDTKVLRQVLKNNEGRKQLEQCLHPLLLIEMNQFLQLHKGQLCFVEVPLLYEVGWEVYFDEVWCLFVEETILRKRLQENRGYTKEEIDMFFQLQMNQKEKCLRATRTLNNSFGQKELEQQVIHYIKEVQYE